MIHSTFRLTTGLLLLQALFLFSCTKPDETLQNTDKQILSFKILRGDSTEFRPDSYSLVWNDFNINILLPYGTERNPLIPVFTFKGFSVSPGSGVAQDFTKPVKYTVTADDGSTAVYTVTVGWGPPPLVYFGSSDFNFYALNAATGNLVWKYQAEGSFVYSSPTYANGTIYAGNTDGYVYAFHPATGNVKWKQKIATTGIESDAVCVNGTVYVGTNDDVLYALDTASGQTKWTYQTGGNISASPTVSNGTVYFGSSDGRLYALDATSGSLKWYYQTGAMINQSGPALVDGVIYVGSRDGFLYAVRATDGSLVWRFNAGGISLEGSSPTVANGTVYIGGWYDVPAFSRPGSLYAIDAATGNLRWEKLNGTGISSSPFVADGKIFITADDGKIHVLNAATGAAVWSKEILANSASPLAYNGVVYVGGGGTRNFYAFNAQTGMELWRFGMPNGLSTSSPLVLPANGVPTHPGDSGSNQ
jgi:outer membrane protein assembly factor BamB